jgi:hypothetical protein
LDDSSRIAKTMGLAIASANGETAVADVVTVKMRHLGDVH